MRHEVWAGHSTVSENCVRLAPGIDDVIVVHRMNIACARTAGFDDVQDIRAVRPDSSSSGQQHGRQRDAIWWRPGTIVELDAGHQASDGLCDATVAVALALFEQDTRVWLSATADCKAVRKYLRYHTACALITEPTLSDFAIIMRLGELSSFGEFFCGTRQYPERATKLIVQVEGLEADGPWGLKGPGIQSGQRLGAKGLGEAFLSQWERNTRLFPRGIDVFLACGRRLCVLPRTTRIEI
jgi:alpha-D-ribose 1-methylphosphonate 5-triphosphate synthase subunit PhnH